MADTSVAPIDTEFLVAGAFDNAANAVAPEHKEGPITDVHALSGGRLLGTIIQSWHGYNGKGNPGFNGA